MRKPSPRCAGLSRTSRGIGSRGKGADSLKSRPREAWRLKKEWWLTWLGSCNQGFRKNRHPRFDFLPDADDR